MINIINKIFESYDFDCVNLNEYVKLDRNNYRDKSVRNVNVLDHGKLDKKYRIKKHIDNLVIFIPKPSNKKFEYFVVASLINPNMNDLNKLIEHDFNNIYSYIKNSKYYNNYMDKNTSLIILLEFDDSKYMLNNSILNKCIFDMEENKYNFKKYVITYSKNQLKKLQEVDKLDGSLLENINEIIYSREDFTDFKLNPTEDSIYNLISKLYIKLPFLKLNSKEEQISSLKEKIEVELGLDGQNGKLNKILDLELDDIKNLSEDDILSISEEVS